MPTRTTRTLARLLITLARAALNAADRLTPPATGPALTLITPGDDARPDIPPTAAAAALNYRRARTRRDTIRRHPAGRARGGVITLAPTDAFIAPADGGTNPPSPARDARNPT